MHDVQIINACMTTSDFIHEQSLGGIGGGISDASVADLSSTSCEISSMFIGSLPANNNIEDYDTRLHAYAC